MRRALECGSDYVIAALLLNGVALFSSQIPGVHTIAAAAEKALRRVLVGDVDARGRGRVASAQLKFGGRSLVAVRRAALSWLSDLLCLPNAFSALEIRGLFFTAQVRFCLFLLWWWRVCCLPLLPLAAVLAIARERWGSGLTAACSRSSPITIYRLPLVLRRRSTRSRDSRGGLNRRPRRRIESRQQRRARGAATTPTLMLRRWGRWGRSRLRRSRRSGRCAVGSASSSSTRCALRQMRRTRNAHYGSCAAKCSKTPLRQVSFCYLLLHFVRILLTI